MALLEVENLRTHFATEEGIARAVDGVSFAVEEGESLALVGESGCGKSVTALSLLGLLPRERTNHPTGKILFEGQNMLTLPEARMRQVRGNRISMIFQEPMTSLNPVFTIATQLMEPLTLHQGMTGQTAKAKAQDLLAQLGMAAPERVMASYPHQLSGGMRQRVMIAMAIACRPRLMIADEPTTALDVTVQAQILHLIRSLQKEVGMALILITHDMGIVNQMSDRVAVMYSGKIVEQASRRQTLEQPLHPYTVKLLESIPRGVGRNTRLRVIKGTVAPATLFVDHCRFSPRCPQARQACLEIEPPLFAIEGEAHPPTGQAGRQAACLLFHPQTPIPFLQEPPPPLPDLAVAHPQQPPAGEEPPLLRVEELTTAFPIKKGFFQREVGRVLAVDGVSLTLREGRTLGLVGESGCGKSTLAFSLLRLETQARGKVVFDGREILSLPEKALRPTRKAMQIIFQDPYSSLNPRMLVGEIVGEGLRVHEPAISSGEFKRRVAEALEEVGLPAGSAGRYAHQFSGGQRQRVALARALVLRPRLLVLDEPTSALDVSVQAQILNLLGDLQQRHQLAYLFISHDLGVVEHLAHEVAVMYLGRVVEYGPTENVFDSPAHPYTRGLLEAQPDITKRHEGPPPVLGDVPSPINPPAGCHFHPRCLLFASGGQPGLGGQCPVQYPPSQNLTRDHWVCCHGANPAEAPKMVKNPKISGTKGPSAKNQAANNPAAKAPAPKKSPRNKKASRS